MRLKGKVFKLIKKVPAGRVTTYSSIAKALSTNPRAVGQALKSNDELTIIRATA